jgi:hypothetical protein
MTTHLRQQWREAAGRTPKGDGIDTCKACGSDDLWFNFFDRNGFGTADDSRPGTTYTGLCNSCGQLQDRPIKRQTKQASESPPPKYKPGDRVYRWWETVGGENPQSDMQPLTIKSVAPKTYKVRTDYGSEFRLPHHHIEGYVDWEDESDADRAERFGRPEVAQQIRDNIKKGPGWKR